ncbi:hypothetical protein [Streptomyces sp. RFCAC02]|uniref:hypothetical protein n=1 Tax=Streptomyces sp. RFCAC02 TaxID=2499143 RepID=UPI0010207E8B|nr:hypothetical protein [Streptomyces sp. RFCAC02]
MRAPYDHAATGSETPIYDALCAEYRRLFLTLPGDRSGEEHLGFVAFGTFRGTGSGTAFPAYGYGYAGALHAPAVLVPAVLRPVRGAQEGPPRTGPSGHSTAH